MNMLLASVHVYETRYFPYTPALIVVVGVREAWNDWRIKAFMPRHQILLRSIFERSEAASHVSSDLVKCITQGAGI